ncbi:MAG TPA: hypothetical protein VEU96_08645 [Bryobacteraceae bacterium]|nr:hypothetical protein [Bryobacteraceae bacterium]
MHCTGSGLGVQAGAVTDGGSVVTVPGVNVMPCGAAPPPPAKLAGVCVCVPTVFVWGVGCVQNGLAGVNGVTGVH